jgi:hypothetical protein
MTVEISRIFLLDLATGKSVEGELRDAIEQAQLDDWQTKWQPALLAVLQGLALKGVPLSQWPQSWHWNWQQKTARVQGLLAFRGFSVVALGETQGLAQVDLTKACRESNQRGRPSSISITLRLRRGTAPSSELRPASGASVRPSSQRPSR